MHELGVVFQVIKTVENIAKENNVESVESVTLQIGQVSGIIDKYLQDCWKWSVEKKSVVMKDSKLVVETIPAITFCEDCQETYPTVKFGKTCPHCKSDKTYLIQGNEFLIKEIGAC